MKGIKINTIKENSLKQVEKKSIWKKDIRLFAIRLKDKEKLNLYRQFHTLSKAKVDINTILDVVISEKDAELKNRFIQVQEDLVGGHELSEALMKTDLFNEFEVYSLRVGEKTGNLEEIFAQLILYYQRKIKQYSLLVNALSYPVLVLIFAILTTIFMLKFIVPIFTDAFKQFGGELPWLTRQIISLSNTFNENLFIILLLFIIIIIGYMRLKDKEMVKNLRHRILLNIPILGGLLEKLNYAQLFGFWKLLLKSKIPMNESIDLLIKTNKYKQTQVSLLACNQSLLMGLSLYEGLKRTKIFNQQTLALIQAGETTNNLAFMFEKLSDSYQETAEQEIEVLGSVIEPVMIILIGGLVGVILIALYMPMFEISNSLGV